ncbi:uncharacterized protein LOC119678815 [Teleopsis dalmanni]|uniref:uncharacterized protein LOC119678815 n=1 Tax=Teleopsis dalmanni TaxID=139649 RepID=UPI0018CD9C50|nr:uncharacterized protein LOC119678815 [Teleopsis dalmanni]
MYKETIRIKGETQGKLDIIRTTNEIPNKQYLNDLYKINKKLNQAKIRPAFGARGEGVVLNNEMSVNTGELRNSVQHNKGPNVLGGVTRGIPESHATISTSSINQVRFIYQNSITKKRDISDASNDTVTSATYKSALLILNTGTPFNFGKLCKKLSKEFFENISSKKDFENVMFGMGLSYTEDVIDFLLKLASDIITSIRPGIQAHIGIFISTESILYKMLDHCLTNYESRSLKFLQNQSDVIKTAVKRHFLSFNPNNSGLQYSCATCSGYYTNYSG